MAAKATQVVNVKIPDFRPVRVQAHIRGLHPLIMHAWSTKAIDMMLSKQLKQGKQKKDAKDPDADYNSSRYLDENGKDCIPATAIKSAVIFAAGFAEGITKVSVRGSIFVEGDLLPIEYDSIRKRQDMVRVGMGVADIRFRPEYTGWKCSFWVTLMPNIISEEQFFALLSIAGRCCGIGERRPQKEGTSFGTFEVYDPSKP